MAIEIVDFASYKMVIFHSYVCLPEGIMFFGSADVQNIPCEVTTASRQTHPPSWISVAFLME